MNNSEKSYYAIIEDKKRGKFSGAGPIEVAKKVASKKLKAGKEIEFYLDEVGGKTKRYGPYQARKDKKTDKVAIIKRGKVMKGGVLSASDEVKLKQFFNNFNYSNYVVLDQQNELPFFLPLRLPLISFGNEPIVFFKPVYIPRDNRNLRFPKKIYNYQYAVFKEGIGKFFYIMIYDGGNTSIVNMDEFFLNPEYSKYFNDSFQKNKILTSLQQKSNIESRRIREEARKIYELFIPTTDTTKQKVIIYSPNYSKPFVRKCVYPDLTFGILDEEKLNTTNFLSPKNNYQKYLILTNTGISGISMNEPIIYVRVPVIAQHRVGVQQIIFDYRIYTDPSDRKKLIIKKNIEQSDNIIYFDENNNDVNIKDICYILLGIPLEFGRFNRIKDVSKLILNRPNIANKFPSKLNSLLTKFPQNQKQLNQVKLQERISEINKLIELSKQPEPKPQKPKLNNYAHRANQGIKLKQQLTNLQIKLQQLQTSRFNQKPQELKQPFNLQQQLSQLQKLLTDNLLEQQKLQQLSKRNQLTKLQQQILQRPESPQQQRIEYLQNKQQQQQQPIFSNAEYSKQRQQELNLFRQQNNREKSLIKQLQKLPTYNNNKYLRERQRQLNLIKQQKMLLKKPTNLYKQQHILSVIQENNNLYTE